MEDFVGRITSPDEAFLTKDPEAPEEPGETVGTSSLLWEYHNKGTLNGVKVDKEDLSLPVDSDNLLVSAFVLDRRPRSEIFVLSPSEGSDKYAELLDRMYKNEIVILEETKQYEPSVKGFVVWVRYDEISYRLNQRYNYLREEIK